MKKFWNRFTALLLSVLTILMSLTTAVSAESADTASTGSFKVFTDADNAILDTDVFAAIKSVQNTALAEKASVQGREALLTEEDMIASIPDIIQAIISSETYVHGTLQADNSRNSLLL